MKATPAALEILGYADKTERGSDALARARAEAVRAYMVACGVSDKHIAVRAEPAGPRCPARDEACRTRNRRAELRFVDGQPSARNAGDAAPAAPPKF